MNKAFDSNLNQDDNIYIKKERIKYEKYRKSKDVSSSDDEEE
jgi:hypothetical protein